MGNYIVQDDFDEDDDADGSDFLTWQRSELPDPLSSSNLEVWQQNFGDLATAKRRRTRIPL